MSFMKLQDLYNDTNDNNISETIFEKNSTKTYFFSALETASKVSSLYKEQVDSLYKSINESAGNIDVIHESFKQFFASISDTIDRFEKSINSTSADFTTDLATRVTKDEFILKDKDIFLNFPEDKRFAFERIKFINFESSIPKPKVSKVSYEKEYDKINDILSDRTKTGDEKLAEFIYLYNSFIDEIQSGFYDEYRAKILGYDDGVKITKAEYGKVLYYTFRDKTKIKLVTSDDVKDAYMRMSSSKRLCERIKSEKKYIQREYDAIKRNISNIQFEKLLSSFGRRTIELEEKFDVYIKLKADQIVNMCTIHMLAYTAKLDALASCYLQDRSILMAAKDMYDLSMEEDGGEL